MNKNSNSFSQLTWCSNYLYSNHWRTNTPTKVTYCEIDNGFQMTRNYNKNATTLAQQIVQLCLFLIFVWIMV
ncbi:hypothetical protein DFA_09813 [Cavenderia fasciculata]|uniref:Uncharacterized protein n=1 Tax=Cavenderia fasciculata TaxID=261658 RepID=F4QAS5_CACFS|nr:uncharacterized protein DFA_09813 [Cavenderia fasciculata]EGG14993.1 hypothetical protein DFA_09813 [Cavenderia fasciculata]|eukprot:XP_004351713.1 hypothetical protein DFA_09813 [Cavenderia fasciculata]